MRLSWAVATAGLLLCGAAQAEEQGKQAPDKDEVALGVGLICNTSEQMQRYVTLRADGAETNRALRAVNDEAHDPRACGLAAVAFMADETVETKSMQGKIVSIVRISIVAAFDGQQWGSVPGMVQYALIEPEGYEI